MGGFIMYKTFLSIVWTTPEKKMFAGWEVAQSWFSFEPLTRFQAEYFFDTLQAVMARAFGEKWYREVSLPDTRKSQVRTRNGSSGCRTVWIQRLERPEFEWYVTTSKVHCTCSGYLEKFKMSFSDLYVLLKETPWVYDLRAHRVVVREVNAVQENRVPITSDDLENAVRSVLATRVLLDPSESPTPEG
jgi:hypothetical protein